VEPAAARYSLRASALTAVLGGLLLFSPSAALAAPGPDPAPHQGGGPQPDPSGGRARLAPAPARPVVAPQVGTVVVRAKPVHRRAVVHRRRARPQAPALPQSAPSRVFNSLAPGLQVPAAASASSGIDRDRLVLAAGALLLVMLLGGSLLLLALTETRALRGP
jgi:hypothetical protein